MKYSANSVWENKDEYDVATVSRLCRAIRISEELPRDILSEK